jgi:hypothetical protein
MLKKLLQTRLFNLIALRALTADSDKRAELTEQIHEIQDRLDSM